LNDADDYLWAYDQVSQLMERLERVRPSRDPMMRHMLTALAVAERRRSREQDIFTSVAARTLDLDKTEARPEVVRLLREEGYSRQRACRALPDVWRARARLLHDASG
jgi:hypothetical protein